MTHILWGMVLFEVALLIVCGYFASVWRKDWLDALALVKRQREMAKIEASGYESLSVDYERLKQAHEQFGERITAYEKADSVRIAAAEAKKAPHRPRTATQARREAEVKMAQVQG